MFELRVLTGRHQGAALPVFGGESMLGQSDDADLLLTDSGVAEHHATLLFVDDRWLLRGAEGKLGTVDGKQTELLDPLPFDQPVALGDAWVSLSPADKPWESMMAAPRAPSAQQTKSEPMPSANAQPPVPSRTFSRSVQVLSVSLILLLSFTVISWILQPTVAQTSAPGSSRPVLETLQEVRPPLLAMLRERGLLPGVKIDMGKNRLVLRGELNRDQQQILDRMLARFKTQYSVMPKLVNGTRLLSTKLPFRIVQITTGARANLVTDSGQRLFIGDQINDLRLVSITSSEVEFDGSEHIRVNW